MAKNEVKKRKLAAQPASPTPKTLKKLKKPSKLATPPSSPPADCSNTSDSEPDSETQPQDIQNLLEPFSKTQLIALLTDHALSDPSLLSKINSLADADVSHRKIFVHGLSWDTTKDDVLESFSQFGEIEDCNLPTDRVTGKAKGYAFVTYKSRKSASKALENPRMKIRNREVSFQLASQGPTGPGVSAGGGTSSGSSVSERKIYVSNVGVEVNVEKLRRFFETFGEIESGPLGFDVETGKCKGYALFVYRTVEGARKALEEPFKLFEGRQLNCSKAAEGKNRGSGGGESGITTAVMPLPLPVQASQQYQQPAMGQQNMAMFGQNLNAAAAAAMGLLDVNQLYGAGLIGNPNVGGLMNLNGYGFGQLGGGAPVLGQTGLVGYGPYGGLLGGSGMGSLGGDGANTSALGAYGVGSGGVMGAVGSTAPMLQGLQHVYPGTPKNKSAPPAKTPGSGAI